MRTGAPCGRVRTRAAQWGRGIGLQPANPAGFCLASSVRGVGAARRLGLGPPARDRRAIRAVHVSHVSRRRRRMAATMAPRAAVAVGGPARAEATWIRVIPSRGYPGPTAPGPIPGQRRQPPRIRFLESPERVAGRIGSSGAAVGCGCLVVVGQSSARGYQCRHAGARRRTANGGRRQLDCRTAVDSRPQQSHPRRHPRLLPRRSPPQTYRLFATTQRLRGHGAPG